MVTNKTKTGVPKIDNGWRYRSGRNEGLDYCLPSCKPSLLTLSVAVYLAEARLPTPRRGPFRLAPAILAAAFQSCHSPQADLTACVHYSSPAANLDRAASPDKAVCIGNSLHTVRTTGDMPAFDALFAVHAHDLHIFIGDVHELFIRTQ